MWPKLARKMSGNLVFKHKYMHLYVYAYMYVCMCINVNVCFSVRKRATTGRTKALKCCQKHDRMKWGGAGGGRQASG